MVQAIRTISLKTKHERVNVFFDKSLKIPDIQIIVDNADRAKAFIEAQYARAIRESLIKFAKQQLYIAQKYPAMEGAEKKINSAHVIINALTDTFGKSLIVLTSSVYWLRSDIYNLQPKENSRFRHNYDTVIAPLVDLCFNHSRKKRLQMLYAERDKRGISNVSSSERSGKDSYTDYAGNPDYTGTGIPETHIRT